MNSAGYGTDFLASTVFSFMVVGGGVLLKSAPSQPCPGFESCEPNTRDLEIGKHLSVNTQTAVHGAPDHVCDWVVSELSRVLSRVLSKVLSRVLRIMFAIGWCQGAARMDL